MDRTQNPEIYFFLLFNSRLLLQSTCACLSVCLQRSCLKLSTLGVIGVVCHASGISTCKRHCSQQAVYERCCRSQSSSVRCWPVVTWRGCRWPLDDGVLAACCLTSHDIQHSVIQCSRLSHNSRSSLYSQCASDGQTCTDMYATSPLLSRLCGFWLFSSSRVKIYVIAAALL